MVFDQKKWVRKERRYLGQCLGWDQKKIPAGFPSEEGPGG